MGRPDELWKTDALVRTFLDGVRGGIPFAAEQIDVMLRLIEARGEPVERFADLGCGSGTLAGAILDRYPKALGILVDFSEPMLTEARRQLSDAASTLRFVCADLGGRDWRHAMAGLPPLDVVVSGYAIHHLPDGRKQDLYREILDLLGPGGLFVNVEHVASPAGWVASISDDLFVDSLWGFHRRLGTGKNRQQIAEEFVHRPDKHANILAPVEEQCGWLRDGGYVDVDCYFKAFELAVFGGRRPGSRGPGSRGSDSRGGRGSG